MKRPESVLYVCCGSKCKKRGGKHVFRCLKADVKEKQLKKNMKVIKTGCTDNCKHGPIVVAMPDNEWWTHVDDEKAKAIFKRVANIWLGGHT